jgi:Cu(I)/Ag(I) efflux system periplasmic protein CusF
MIRNFAVAFLASALLAPPAYADDAHPKRNAAQGSTHTAAMSDGEVRKVDKEAKKITLRHGPLQNLDMPAMTMVFQVSDAALLDQVKAGDKVKFVAEKRDGAFVITKIELAK